jgi:hypothetical protein
MAGAFQGILIVLAGLLSGQYESGHTRVHSDKKTPSAVWRKLTIDSLPRDDRNLWRRYHAGRDPGATAVKNACLGRKVQFEAQIRFSNAGLEERIIYSHRGRLHHVFGPKKVVSPFVIWTVGPGKTTDVSSGKSYNVKGQSLIFEKIESVAYQYMCNKGRLLTITTAD